MDNKQVINGDFVVLERILDSPSRGKNTCICKIVGGLESQKGIYIEEDGKFSKVFGYGFDFISTLTDEILILGKTKDNSDGSKFTNILYHYKSGRFTDELDSAEFSKGVVVTNLGGKKGILNSYLKPIIDINYSDIEVINDSLFIVMDNDKFNLVDCNGDSLINGFYDSIKYNDSYIEFCRNGEESNSIILYKDKYLFQKYGDKYELVNLELGLVYFDDIDSLDIKDDSVTIFRNGKKITLDYKCETVI